MAADAVFLDTNVLVYASRAASEKHLATLNVLGRLSLAGYGFWISSQVIREYLAVVTRPQGGFPQQSVSSALDDVRRFVALFHLAEEPDSTLARLLALVEKHDCSGSLVHDTQIVACMLENGIHRLLTFNHRDFRRFSSDILIEPTPEIEQ